MSRSLRPMLAVLVALVLATPSVAVAAPTPWQAVDVILQGDQQQPMLLVSGQLPRDTKLPYEAEIAVPAGLQVQWVGEILGGPTASDPEMKYVKTTRDGVDVYRFTLTKSRIAQVEGTVQGFTGTDGTNQTTALQWKAWQAVPSVRISQRIPQSVRIVSAAPGATIQPSEGGYGYYTKTVQNVKAGDVVDLSFSYASGTAPVSGTTGQSGSGANTMWTLVILILVAAGMVVAFFGLRSKIAAKPASVDDDRTVSTEAPRSKETASTGRQDGRKEAGDGPRKRVNMTLPTIAVVAVFVVGLILVAVVASMPQTAEGKITANFGSASVCASTSIPVTPKPGVDLKSEGRRLVEAFKGQQGIGDVTLDLVRSVVDVGYCTSSQTEQSVRQTIAGTGMVDVIAAPAASTPTTAGVAAP